MAATVCALPLRFPIEAAVSCTGHTSHPGLQIRTNVRFPTGVAGLSLRRQGGRDSREGGRQIYCAAEGGEGKSCCEGSNSGEGGVSSGTGGKCSSHGGSESDVDVSSVGKEFEALVAQKTMQEFEAQYETGQMEGTITRDVIADVVNIYPETVINKSEERFLDVDELLAEARALSISDGEFVFDADFEDMLV